MPKKKYHTPVNGMFGTGTPVIDAGAQDAEGQKNSGTLTGGAFSGMQINDEIKKQIEAGGASRFLYFTESKEEPGMYDMHTKLPEYGCGGPGKSIYKFRENYNRLMQGTAKKYLKADGTPDLRKGSRFMAELYRRFGFDGHPFSMELPGETDPEVLKKNATDWLCDELDIPYEEQNDFKEFCRDNIFFPGENTPLAYNNYYNLWNNFTRNCITLDELSTMENSPFAGLIPGGNADNVFQKNTDSYTNAVKELNRIAAIDPAKEKKMILPNECSGSRAFLAEVVKKADQAAVEMGQESVQPSETFFRIAIKDIIKEQQTIPVGIQVQINQLSAEAERENDPQKKDDIEKSIIQKRKELEDAKKTAEALPDPNNLKWDFHEAGVIGSFTTGEGKNKKTWYLTAEAFAAESDSLVEHPGVTDEISIGVYSGKKDFIEYYKKDDPEVDHEMQDVVQFERLRGQKDAIVLDKLEAITEEDETYSKIKKLSEPFRDDYRRVKQEINLSGPESAEIKTYKKPSTGEYVTTAAIRGEANTEYMLEFSENIRQMRSKRSGVPKEHIKQYDRVLTDLEKLFAFNSRINDSYVVYLKLKEEWGEKTDDLKKKVITAEQWENLDRIAVGKNGQNEDGLKINDLKKELEKAEEQLAQIDEIINRYEDQLDDIREKEMLLWNKVLKKFNKGEDFDSENVFDDQADAVSFKHSLEHDGRNAGNVLNFLGGMSKNMMPVKEARLEIQSNGTALSAGFLAKEDMTSLTGPELDFASLNMDSMFESVFSKNELEKIKADGGDVTDRLFIEGVSISELTADKYAGVDDRKRRIALKKAEALKMILAGKQADLLRGYVPDEINGGMKPDVIPVKVESEEKNIAPVLSRQKYAAKERIQYPEQNFMDELTYINGEKEAERTGWSRTDMRVMGILSAMESRVDKYGDPAMKNAFAGLKGEVAGRRALDLAVRAEFTSKVKDFLEANKDNAAFRGSFYEKNSAVISRISDSIAKKREDFLNANFGKAAPVKQDKDSGLKTMALNQLRTYEHDKNWEELASELIRIQARTMSYGTARQSDVDALAEYMKALKNGGEDGRLSPGKEEVVKGLARAFGMQRARLQIAVGREKEELTEKILKGEVPGTEQLAEDRQSAEAVANAYADIAGENAGKLSALDSLSTQMAMALEEYKIGGVDSEEALPELLAEGVNDHKAEYNDQQKDEAERLFERGFNTGGKKAKQIGYEINVLARSEGQPMFAAMPEKAMTEDEIRLKAARNAEQGRKVAEYKNAIRDVAYEASVKLTELENMKKKGHVNSDSYNVMHDTLQKIAGMDGTWLPENIQTGLKELKKASEDYERDHDKWYKAAKGYGQDRLNMSRTLKGQADVWYETLDQKSDGISKSLSVDRQLEKVRAELNKQDEELKNRRADRKTEEVKPVEIKQEGGTLTIDQFKYGFANLGLSDQGFNRLYMSLTDDEVKDAAFYLAGRGREYNPFTEWDNPLARGGKKATSLSEAARLSGNPAELKEYLDNNAGNLNAADTAFLLKHIELPDKIKRINEEQKNNLVHGGKRPEKPAIYEDENGYTRLNISQPAEQSCSHGCWSVCLQQIVQSRGISGVEQEDIRAFRPEKFKMKGMKDKEFEYADNALNKDSGAVASEMLDSVMAMAPNTMVRMLDIERFDPGNEKLKQNNIDTETYRKNATELVRQTVEKAIHIDHSPVMIKDQEHAHYLSIVGIKGDKLLIQDPLKWDDVDMTEDRMREIDISVFVERIVDNGPGEPLQLIWGSDLEIDRKGKIIGLPEQSVKVDLKGNVIPAENQREYNESNTELVQNGQNIFRFGRAPEGKNDNMLSKDGVLLREQIYLPKKLEIDALAREALNRDPKEEEKRKAQVSLYDMDTTQLKGISIKDAVQNGYKPEQKMRDGRRKLEKEEVKGLLFKGSSGEKKKERNMAVSHTDSLSFTTGQNRKPKLEISRTDSLSFTAEQKKKSKLEISHTDSLDYSAGAKNRSRGKK